jgi:hypothetical protein
MRYWQISRIRLGRAARKLTMDNEWHSFESTPYAWYRVWNKRLVQRVNFDNEDEEKKLLPLIQNITPLQELASVTGFREEIQVVWEADALFVTLPLGYEPANIEAIRKKLKQYGIRLVDLDKLLYARIPIEAVTKAELENAQSKIVAVRLFFQAASLSADARTMNAATEGFDKIMAEAG